MKLGDIVTKVFALAAIGGLLAGTAFAAFDKAGLGWKAVTLGLGAAGLLVQAYLNAREIERTNHRS